MGIMGSFTYKKVSAILKQMGCEFIEFSNASHALRKTSGGKLFSVIRHKNDPLDKKTLDYMLEVSGLSKQEFMKIAGYKR